MRFASFVVRRTARATLTLLAVILITFLLFRAFPTGPEIFVYPDKIAHGTITDADVHRARAQLGLDRPLLVQYLDYVGRLARGDLGTRWLGIRTDPTGRIVSRPPVRPDLFPYVRITLAILLGGAVLVLLLAVPLGAVAGTRIGSWTDRGISFFALVGVCIHPMMLGLILGSAARGLGWLSTDGYCPLVRGPTDTCGGFSAWSSHLVLPWLTFALLFLALYTRVVRASVAETVHEEYVRTARAKGASELRVVGRHVLPSASLKVLTMIGMEIGTAIGVAAYIEAAFHIRGLGTLAVFTLGGGSRGVDLPFTLALVVVITLIVVVGNLVVDILHGALDPRTAGTATTPQTKSLAGGVI
jgi:peptide/nickel transport system permease protein